MRIDPITHKLFSSAGNHGFVTLMYHAIAQGKPDHPWAVSLTNFGQQMALLRDHGWTSICAQQLKLGIDQLPSKTVLITFDDGYANNMPAFELLAKLGLVASWFVVTHDIGKLSSWSDSDTPKNQLLSKAQLWDMQKAGMEIGSHTQTHARLTQVPKQQLAIELCHSKDCLSALLGQSITSFAYPYGLYNQDIVLATKAAGYDVGFTTQTGFGLIKQNLLEVRRISIMADDSLSSFARKLTFADNNVGWPKLGGYIFQRAKARLNL
ncbi:MAG: polysaccharide deacetylase family protein [Methylococcaceae bacterium]|jgi:peptidoglycan/xylan/chitin deacetylase (PgdA/CDA1 family)